MAGWGLLDFIPAQHGSDPTVGGLVEQSGNRLRMVGGAGSRALTDLVFSPEGVSWERFNDADHDLAALRSLAAYPGWDRTFWVNTAVTPNALEVAEGYPSDLEAYYSDFLPGPYGADAALSSANQNSPGGSYGFLLTDSTYLQVINGRYTNLEMAWDTTDPNPPADAPVHTTALFGSGVRSSHAARPTFLLVGTQDPPGGTPSIYCGWVNSDTQSFTAEVAPPAVGPMLSAGDYHYLLDAPSGRIHVFDPVNHAWSDWGGIPREEGASVTFAPIAAALGGMLVFEMVSPTKRALVMHPATLSGPTAGVVDLPAVAGITLDVGESEFLTRTQVTIQLTVDAPPRSRVEALIAFHTGNIERVTAIIELDVDAPLPDAPNPTVPLDPTAIIPPGGSLPPRRRVEACRADDYSLSWGPGGQLVGTARALSQRGTPTVSHGFALESHLPGVEWEEDGSVWATVDYQPDTVDAAQSTTLPELMPIDDINALSLLPDDGDCPTDDDATLCDEDILEDLCDARAALKDQVLPTRLALAQEALAAAGVSLSILGGASGIPGGNRPVDEAYRTLGKTPLQVVGDLLLTANPLTWFAPGVMMIHGGNLPMGSISIPSGCTSGSITTRLQAPALPPEPLLEDYLSACGNQGDCDAFELAEDAEIKQEIWREDENGRTRVVKTVTKEGGQVVREVEEVEKVIPERWAPPGQPVDVGSLKPLSTTTTTYDYLECCPDALARSEAVTRAIQSISLGLWWMLTGEERITAREVVEHDWHAEGWLRTRVATSFRETGTTGDGRILTEEAEHEERWRPVGGGLWQYTWRRTTVGGLERIITTEAGSSNTDEPPPQVRCEQEGFDPCRPRLSCEALAEEQHAEDHEMWSELVTALQATTPTALLEMSLDYNGIRRDIRPGRQHAGWLVTSVSFSSSGVTNGPPSESTSVQLVAAGA